MRSMPMPTTMSGSTRFCATGCRSKGIRAWRRGSPAWTSGSAHERRRLDGAAPESGGGGFAAAGAGMSVAIVLETHSVSTDNELGIATGWLDGRLSERGRRLAQELGERRRTDDIAAVFTSDLRRA